MQIVKTHEKHEGILAQDEYLIRKYEKADIRSVKCRGMIPQDSEGVTVQVPTGFGGEPAIQCQ